MENMTIGTFAASLNVQIGEHGGDTIETIEPDGEDYLISAKTHSGAPVSLRISAANAEAAVSDAVDDEIAAYSVMENTVYMTWVAGRLLINKVIPDVPRPVLVPAIIQIAEAFDLEHGSDMVSDDTVKAINQYAEEKLIERFGQ